MSGRAAGTLCVAAALIASGCGGDEEDPYTRADQLRDIRKERMSIVEAQVRRGELPPITKRLFELDGRITLEVIDGPNGDEDVIRTKANGTRGPKLKWDLDQDGKISPDEREITERELYDATLPAADEARRRVMSGPDGRKS